MKLIGELSVVWSFTGCFIGWSCAAEFFMDNECSVAMNCLSRRKKFIGSGTSSLGVEVLLAGISLDIKTIFHWTQQLLSSFMNDLSLSFWFNDLSISSSSSILENNEWRQMQNTKFIQHNIINRSTCDPINSSHKSQKAQPQNIVPETYSYRKQTFLLTRHTQWLTMAHNS